ncbi:MAG: hypothetical protein OEY14_08635, partial [Myxococcales bacterium]|nr:hypothetical protein [Myxococcales bacterium]
MSIPPRSRALAASLLAIGLLGLIAEPRRAPAQGPSLIELSTRSSEDARIRLAVDADDSDEDGLPDAAELEGVPHQDLLELVINAAPSGAQVQVHGPVRLIDEGGRPSTRLEVRGRTRLWVQGLRASRRAGDARLHVQEGTREQSLEFTVVGMAWLDASNAPIDGTRQALRLSHRITNDTSLPLYPSWDETSPDPQNVRVELFDPGSEAGEILRVDLVSRDASGRQRDRLRHLELRRP